MASILFHQKGSFDPEITKDLQKKGHNCTIVTSLQDAAARISQKGQRYDLVVLHLAEEDMEPDKVEELATHVRKRARHAIVHAKPNTDMWAAASLYIRDDMRRCNLLGVPKLLDLLLKHLKYL